MDGPALACLDRRAAVDGLAEDVEHAAEQGLAHGHRQGGAGVANAVAAGQAARRVEPDAAHRRAVDVRLHLEHDFALAGHQATIARRQRRRETHVDDVAAHGRHLSLPAAG